MNNTQSKWKSGAPNLAGTYIVKYTRSRSKNVSIGMAIARGRGGADYTIFNSRNGRTVDYTLDPRRGTYAAPSILAYKKVN